MSTQKNENEDTQCFALALVCAVIYAALSVACMGVFALGMTGGWVTTDGWISPSDRSAIDDFVSHAVVECPGDSISSCATALLDRHSAQSAQKTEAGGLEADEMEPFFLAKVEREDTRVVATLRDLAGSRPNSGAAELGDHSYGVSGSKDAVHLGRNVKVCGLTTYVLHEWTTTNGVKNAGSDTYSYKVEAKWMSPKSQDLQRLSRPLDYSASVSDNEWARQVIQVGDNVIVMSKDVHADNFVSQSIEVTDEMIDTEQLNTLVEDTENGWFWKVNDNGLELTRNVSLSDKLWQAVAIEEIESAAAAGNAHAAAMSLTSAAVLGTLNECVYSSIRYEWEETVLPEEVSLFGRLVESKDAKGYAQVKPVSLPDVHEMLAEYDLGHLRSFTGEDASEYASTAMKTGHVDASRFLFPLLSGWFQARETGFRAIGWGDVAVGGPAILIIGFIVLCCCKCMCSSSKGKSKRD